MARALIQLRSCSSVFTIATDDVKDLLYMVVTTFKDPCSVSTGKCGPSNSQAGFMGDSAQSHPQIPLWTPWKDYAVAGAPRGLQ